MNLGLNVYFNIHVYGKNFKLIVGKIKGILITRKRTAFYKKILNS